MKNVGILIFIVVLVTSCQFVDLPSDDSGDTDWWKEYYLSVSTPEVVYPEYVRNVWPPPDSVLSQSNYKPPPVYVEFNGVGARIRPDIVIQNFYGEFCEEIENSDNIEFDLFKNTTLNIDGNTVSENVKYSAQAYDASNIRIVCLKSDQVAYEGPEAIDIAWLIPLEVGHHKVVLIIENKQETQQLEYSWQFEISDP